MRVIENRQAYVRLSIYAAYKNLAGYCEPAMPSTIGTECVFDLYLNKIHQITDQLQIQI